MKRTLSLAVISILLLITQNVYGKSPDLTGAASYATTLSLDTVISPDLQDSLEATTSEEMVRVIVTMKDHVDLSTLPAFNRTDRLQAVIELLQSKAVVSQRAVTAYLDIQQRQGTVGEVISFWIFNGLAVEATPDVVRELAARRDVLRITPNETIAFAPDETTTEVIEPNISKVNAPALWDLGYRGQGCGGFHGYRRFWGSSGPRRSMERWDKQLVRPIWRKPCWPGGFQRARYPYHWSDGRSFRRWQRHRYGSRGAMDRSEDLQQPGQRDHQRHPPRIPVAAGSGWGPRHPGRSPCGEQLVEPIRSWL
jgi:hypothetical protein